MKANYLKIGKCNHCQKDYQIARIDQKFCSTSCRSANHSWKKRLAIKAIAIPKFQKSVLKNEPLPVNQPNITDQDLIPTMSGSEQVVYKPSFLKDTAAAAIPILINEGIKSVKQINNSDIVELLLKNQAALLELNKEVKTLKDELKVKNTELDSNKKTKVQVTLLN